jgi:hypothetical protein
MALQAILDSVDGLPDAIKAEYKEVDGKFHLDVVGGEDTGALKRAKDHEKNLRVAAEGRVADLQTQIETLTGERDTAIQERDAAKNDKGKDVQALEASWQAKVDAANAKLETTQGELTREIERLLVTNTATSLAHEISTVPELFGDVIARRLKVEKGADGQYFTRVLDEAGTPSAKTLDELKQELLANKKYAAIIISGKGSGGGAGGPGSGGGAAEKKWLEYSDAELVELRKTDPEKYDRLKQAHQAAPGA